MQRRSPGWNGWAPLVRLVPTGPLPYVAADRNRGSAGGPLRRDHADEGDLELCSQGVRQPMYLR